MVWPDIQALGIFVGQVRGAGRNAHVCFEVGAIVLVTDER
jgi:hypothetical protein